MADKEKEIQDQEVEEEEENGCDCIVEEGEEDELVRNHS